MRGQSPYFCRNEDTDIFFSNSNGSPVVISDCNKNDDNRLWTIQNKTISAYDGSMCLDVTGGDNATLMVRRCKSGSVCHQEMSTSSGSTTAFSSSGGAKNAAWTSQTEAPKMVAGFKSGNVWGVLKPLIFVSSLTPVIQSRQQSKHVSVHYFIAVRD